MKKVNLLILCLIATLISGCSINTSEQTDSAEESLISVTESTLDLSYITLPNGAVFVNRIGNQEIKRVFLEEKENKESKAMRIKSEKGLIATSDKYSVYLREKTDAAFLQTIYDEVKKCKGVKINELTDDLKGEAYYTISFSYLGEEATGGGVRVGIKLMIFEDGITIFKQPYSVSKKDSWIKFTINKETMSYIEKYYADNQGREVNSVPSRSKDKNN